MKRRKRRNTPQVDKAFADYDPILSHPSNVSDVPLLTLFTLEDLLVTLPALVEEFERLVEGQL